MNDLYKLDLSKVLYLDIETVSGTENYESLSEEGKALWEQKSHYQRGDTTAEDFYEKSGIWAEFGKIICISVGFFKYDGKKKERAFRIKSFYGDDERELLLAFKVLLEKYFNKTEHRLCAHNGKEFDFPYIARRMIVHQIKLPSKLSLFGKKPWEITHLDTMELWRFGDYKHYTSLRLLTYILGIPSPKDDIDGSMVGKVYYEEGDLDKIVNYCQKDVLATAQVFLKYRNEDLLTNQEISYIKESE